MNKPTREGFVDDSAPIELKDVTPKVPEPEFEPEAPSPEEVPEWPMVIKLLHKPIQKSRTEILHELTFREPTALDIIKCGGNPCRITTR